jgi:hypothetical protein
MYRISIWRYVRSILWQFLIAVRPGCEHSREQRKGFLFRWSRFYTFLRWVRNVFIMLEILKQFRFPCLDRQATIMTAQCGYCVLSVWLELELELWLLTFCRSVVVEGCGTCRSIWYSTMKVENSWYIIVTIVQVCTDTSCQVTRATKFCTEAPDICGSLIQNSFHLTSLAHRISRKL